MPTHCSSELYFNVFYQYFRVSNRIFDDILSLFWFDPLFSVMFYINNTHLHICQLNALNLKGVIDGNKYMQYRLTDTQSTQIIVQKAV